MGKIEYCQHCGAKMVAYKHTINKGMAGSLLRAYSVVRPGTQIKVSSLGLTHNQQANWQKLRYWGLIDFCYNENGTRDDGWWVVTEKGMEFVEGKISIPKNVKTYRKDVTWQSEEQLWFKDVDEGYARRIEWAEGATPMGGAQ